MQPVFFLKKEIEECKKVSISECINEAILNSIQAKATKIAIMVNTIAKQENLFNNIKSVEIIDNGVGFNEKNKEAFNTLKTENKKDKGCKGYGRMYFKKAFSDVKICSFNGDKDNEKVNFVFDEEHFINTDIELHQHSQRERERDKFIIIRSC